MPSWIEQAAHRGILTTRFPRTPATEEEVPASARAPVAPDLESLGRARDACPVGAITEWTVDQGRCIRCARCLPAGLAFRGPVDASTRSRAALVTGETLPSSAGEPPVLPGFRRSLHLFLVDVGSCNACNLEVLAIANPFYDSQRLGIFFTNSPRHADVLLVVGVPTPEMREPLRRAFEAIPAPKAVVAVGACPISGGAFSGTPGLAGGLDELLPVDVFVPGCPPPPVALLAALARIAGTPGRREA
ncbi:MAG TPA: NADH:ubiquinone oxidoreductase [Thermoplasmata archaeon]|nr:NADH:ubiquinone oxidoreductase [Thermoplasmata archaeon]